MRATDFAPLYRSTVGFDRLFSMLDSATKGDDASWSYPPYNIEVTGDDAYRVTMAVAGFAREDLTIEARENQLVITGDKAPETDVQKRFLHRGIAGRSFERRFELADHVKVAGAALENGLLHVELVREIPETAKPRRIEIGSAPVLQGKAA